MEHVDYVRAYLALFFTNTRHDPSKPSAKHVKRSRHYGRTDEHHNAFGGRSVGDIQNYNVPAGKHPGITHAACWAHVRRKFHEALQTGQHYAAGPLRAIARHYNIEKDLGQTRAGPEQRPLIRQRKAKPSSNVFGKIS